MTPRRLLILGIVALVAIGGGLWLAQRQSGAPANSYGLLYPDLKKQLGSVTAVRIYKAGDARAVEIARKDPDKDQTHEPTWGVSERGGYPVDAAKLRKLLLALADAKVFEEKTSNPEQYKSLGVEDTGAADAASVRIELAGPAQPVNLIVGKPGIGAQSQYVRRAGEAPSWLVNATLDSAASPDAWLNKDIIDIGADRVQSAAVTGAGAKTYTVAKGSRADANFNVDSVPKGKELSSPAAANSFATALVGVTLADVQPASAMPAGAPSAHATYKTFDGLVADIDGWVRDDKHYIAVRTSFDGAHAERFRIPTADDKKDPKAGDDAKSAQDAPDVASQAATLNAKLSGWVYEVPSYKYEAIFRPLDELLKHEASKKKDLFKK